MNDNSVVWISLCIVLALLLLICLVCTIVTENRIRKMVGEKDDESDDDRSSYSLLSLYILRGLQILLVSSMINYGLVIYFNSLG